MLTENFLYWIFPIGFAIVAAKYIGFLPYLVRLQQELPRHGDILRSYAWVVAFGGFAVLPCMTLVAAFWISRHAGAETGVEGALWAAAATMIGFLLWVLQCALATTCRHMARIGD